jgi:hypothetical protein
MIGVVWKKLANILGWVTGYYATIGDYGCERGVWQQ